MIGLAGVEVRLGGTDAIRGVTLSLPSEQWLAIVGPNGAGKTSLLRCVADLVAHRGAVLVAGRDVAGMRRRELARCVAYVPQEPMFPDDMTAGEYVLLGRTAHTGRFGSESSHDRRVCGDLLDRLGLAAFAGRRVGTMSGGERQRLVLARALAQQAPILLLDEPTSALDLGRRVDALELVDDLRRERGLTVVSVVHDLTLAGQFADRLALMHEGKVVSEGPPGEVLREDRLSRAFGRPVRVLRQAGELVVMSQRLQPGTDRSAR